MGRGVSVPYSAEVVKYVPYSPEELGENLDLIMLEFYGVLKKKYPALEKCSEWLGREDFAFAENKNVYVGYSAYGGVVAIWVVPRNNGLAKGYCDIIAKGFSALVVKFFGVNMVPAGVGSNGVPCYNYVKP